MVSDNHCQKVVKPLGVGDHLQFDHLQKEKIMMTYIPVNNLDLQITLTEIDLLIDLILSDWGIYVPKLKEGEYTI